MKTHATLLAALMGALVLSCSDDKSFDPEPQPDPYLAPASPANVLENLQHAYRERALDRYLATLTVDGPHGTYVFIPSPSDEGLGYNQLTYTEERDVAENMFREVADIEIELVYDENRPLGDPSSVADYPHYLGYREVIVTDVNLRITTRDDPVDPTIYVVDGDPALFVFEPDSTATPVTYKVIYQEDQSTGAGLLTVETTWGTVKAVYRR